MEVKFVQQSRVSIGFQMFGKQSVYKHLFNIILLHLHIVQKFSQISIEVMKLKLPSCNQSNVTKLGSLLTCPKSNLDSHVENFSHIQNATQEAKYGKTCIILTHICLASYPGPAQLRWKAGWGLGTRLYLLVLANNINLISIKKSAYLRFELGQCAIDRFLSLKNSSSLSRRFTP